MQRVLFFLLLSAAFGLTVSGCGNKGPLYLPAEPAAQTADAVVEPEVEAKVEPGETTDQ